MQEPSTTRRSRVTARGPLQAGHGSSRIWTRLIRGQLYSFTAVLMPDGERRYAISQLQRDPSDSGPIFGCDWRRVHFIVFKPQAAEKRLVKLTVINGMDGLMHVHAAGCVDLTRGRNRTHTNGRFDIEVATRTEALIEIWADFIEEWAGDISVGEDSTQVYPCVSFPEGS